MMVENKDEVTREEEKLPLNASQIRHHSSKSMINMVHDDCDIKKSLTKYDYAIVAVLAFGNFCVACGVSIQGPFFPKEAESKGASPMVYGSIFGIYELVMLFTSFLFGRLVGRLSAGVMSGFGLLVTGAATVLFGLLDRAPGGYLFIVSAFVTRIAESLGATAFATSSYSMITLRFPDKSATMFSVMETNFGVGLIIGPAFGGALYLWGGYILPFTVLGALIMIGSIVIFVFVSPNESLNKSETIADNNNERDRESDAPVVRFLLNPVIILDSLVIISALMLIGFNAATLEPHLRQFSLSPLNTGLVFVSLGSMYALTVPVWGKLCDTVLNRCLPVVAIIGGILCAVGLALIGPLPFTRAESSLWLVLLSLMLFGIGTAAKQVSGFSHALSYSIGRRGFANNAATHGLVSALFFACISLGGFIGPIIGGFLLENFGYKSASMVLFVAEIAMLVIVILVLVCLRKF